MISHWLCRAMQQRGARAAKEGEDKEKDEESEEDLQRAREFDEFKDGKRLLLLVNCADLLLFFRSQKRSRQQARKGVTGHPTLHPSPFVVTAK